jgi:3'-phosphoadenosine 5'-phosphosulfate sulfotransferase (PAPS reductase)/FAD synthetase
VYISFSGGKDSTVLLDLARRIYPNITAVFCNTGLEYPQIRAFVKTIADVQTIKPLKRFDEVIDEYGYPVISKEISKIVYGARHSKHKKQSYINKLLGLNPDGTYSEYKQRYKKWVFMLDAPFEISNRCCYWLKEKPFMQYEKLTGNKPIIGTMAENSRQRKDGWLKTGCNAIEGKRPISKPLSFWTEQDILKYIITYNLSYSKEYGDIVEHKSKLVTTGEKSTGCMFCMYGCHLDKVNRFQRMRGRYPKQYDYCINKLGIGKVLDYINVEY